MFKKKKKKELHEVVLDVKSNYKNQNLSFVPDVIFICPAKFDILTKSISGSLFLCDIIKAE